MLKCKKVTWLTIVLACLLVFPLAMGCGGPAEEPAPAEAPKAEVYNWRLQGMHASEDERFVMLHHLADNLVEMSQGQINITIYPSGALVPIEEIPGAMKEGVIDMAHACGGYWGGLDPVLNTGPGLWDFREQWETDNFMHNKGGNEIMRAAYAKLGMYFIDTVLGGGVEMVYSNKPIRHVEDYQGLKMRSFGQYSWFFEELGAATIYLPGDEIVPALATGTIDAAEWSSAFANYNVGFHEVTKYQCLPYFIWALGSCEITMGLDLWNSLPKHVQSMVSLTTREASAFNNKLTKTNDAIYFKKMLDEGPMEELWIPTDEWPQLVAAAEAVRDKLAAESPESAQMVKLTRDYMRELGYLK